MSLKENEMLCFYKHETWMLQNIMYLTMTKHRLKYIHFLSLCQLSGLPHEIKSISLLVQDNHETINELYETLLNVTKRS